MISRPGVRIGLGLEVGVAPGSMEMVRFAIWPLIFGVCVAFAIALLMRETYPLRSCSTAGLSGVSADGTKSA